MHVVYYDESGDDGFPKYASPIFVLSAVYCPALDWRKNFDLLSDFRRELSKNFNFPFKLEIHTRELLLNKKPYAPLGLSDSQRLSIIRRFSQAAAQLSIRSVTTAVIKPWIKQSNFDVLDKALSYSINRIENDLGVCVKNRFLIITDDGRVGKMRTTTRRLQRVNFIPSHFQRGIYNRQIQLLIEDPLPKDSKESYFIQLADMIAYLFYEFFAIQKKICTLPKRAPAELDYAFIESCLDTLRGVLNEKASNKHDYGLVIIPNNP